MAEHISGSEDAFVAKMNEKAQVLGMKHTHFVNCCGLDADGHYTSARDIALMSRELITNHPDIFHYTTIWMENITHVTKRGESEFGLSNTNKLLRHYQGATGLKTGSTSKAGFCLSATAERNHISLIAVVMACQSAKERVKDCASLLDYGFSLCKIYTDKQYIMAQKNSFPANIRKTSPMFLLRKSTKITFRKKWYSRKISLLQLRKIK